MTFSVPLQNNRGFKMETKREIKTSVKDESLIEMRREQMIQGAVKLFKEKGFHRTTTREIAKEAGFSIGTLYEYIRTKEDVLFLVCDSIYNEVNDRLYVLANEEGTVKGLRSAIQQYFELIDDMSDEFVVMYQETKSLPKDALQYVLKKEMQMVALFENILQSCVELGELRINKTTFKSRHTTSSFKGKCGHFEDGHYRKTTHSRNSSKCKQIKFSTG